MSPQTSFKTPIPPSHPLNSILSQQDLHQFSSSLEKLANYFNNNNNVANRQGSGNSSSSATESIHASPLSLLNSYLSNLDLPALQQENKTLKQQKRRLANQIANVTDAEKNLLVEFQLEWKKLPKGLDTLTVEVLHDAESEFVPLKEPKLNPIKLNWPQESLFMLQEEFNTDFQRIGDSRTMPTSVQVYNSSKDKMVLLVFEYDEDNVQSLKEAYLAMWAKGKLKSIEKGALQKAEEASNNE